MEDFWTLLRFYPYLGRLLISTGELPLFDIFTPQEAQNTLAKMLMRFRKVPAMQQRALFYLLADPNADKVIFAQMCNRSRSRHSMNCLGNAVAWARRPNKLLW